MKLGKATIDIKTTGITKVQKDLDTIIDRLENIKRLCIEINKLYFEMVTNVIDCNDKRLNK